MYNLPHKPSKTHHICLNDIPYSDNFQQIPVYSVMCGSEIIIEHLFAFFNLGIHDKKRPAFLCRTPSVLVFLVCWGNEPSGDLPSGSSIIIHVRFVLCVRFSDNHQLACSRGFDPDVPPWQHPSASAHQ